MCTCRVLRPDCPGCVLAELIVPLAWRVFAEPIVVVARREIVEPNVLRARCVLGLCSLGMSLSILGCVLAMCYGHIALGVCL